jgi:hypothetical protein
MIIFLVHPTEFIFFFRYTKDRVNAIFPSTSHLIFNSIFLIRELFSCGIAVQNRHHDNEFFHA